MRVNQSTLDYNKCALDSKHLQSSKIFGYIASRELVITFTYKLSFVSNNCTSFIWFIPKYSFCSYNKVVLKSISQAQGEDSIGLFKNFIGVLRFNKKFYK